jgi:hypothetical protein
LFASLLAVAVVVELGVRLVVPVTDCYWYFRDPLIGSRIKPNQEGRRIKGRAIDAKYHFNAQGWNHPDDYSTAKARGARRICLVGDSQVESLQVDVADAMFCVAQKEMSRPGRPVEWYAFGNSGWGPNIEYEVIRHYVLDFQPDLVILLFVQNDPFDCSPYLVDPSRFWPLYYLDETDRLVLVPPSADWRSPGTMELASHSAFFRFVMFQLQVYDRLLAPPSLRGGVGGLPLRVTGAASRGVPIPGLDGMTVGQRQARTWLLIEKLLEACRDECRRRGARFAVAFRGWMDDIDAPITGIKAAQKPREQDPYCLDEHGRLSEMGRDWLAPMAARLGIPYLDLTDALREHVAATRQSHTFVDDMHFNAAAHQAAGKALASWADSLLELPR